LNNVYRYFCIYISKKEGGKTKQRTVLIAAVMVIVIAGGLAYWYYVIASAPKLVGTIEIDGSSTVFPITAAVAEEFQNLNPDVRVNVGISGTGGGFKRFTVGEIEISDASRPIKSSEAEAAQQNGIEYIEFSIALDGLSVVVNHQHMG